MALGGALGSGLGAPWSRMTPRHFAWQAWHKLTSTLVSRGRRGTNSHPPSFRVAGVALMAVGGALGSGLGAPILRGSRGTNSNPPSFRLAGVAQTHIHLRFAWQAWHKLASTFASRGRRGTISHPPSFRVAGVALMALGGALGSGLGAPWSRVTPRHFAWQAWHKLTSTLVSRGRCGTI